MTLVMRCASYILVALAALAGVMAGVILFVLVATHPYIYHDAASVPERQVALVLGASVLKNGTLSPVLAARADKAIELYEAKKVQKILVTGDNSDESHNEVNPVGLYLVAHGIPKSDIFLDHDGLDTYSSMYRAKHIFEVSSMIVASQQFHLWRSVLIARSLGIDAVGVDADNRGVVFYNTEREVPATFKALYDLATHRTPKYLGAVQPVSGDGSATW